MRISEERLCELLHEVGLVFRYRHSPLFKGNGKLILDGIYDLALDLLDERAKTAALTAERDALAETCRVMRDGWEQARRSGFCNQDAMGLALTLPITEAEARVTANQTLKESK